MLRYLSCLFAIVVIGPSQIRADDPPPTTSPRPTPLTRPDMKQMIEDMKMRKRHKIVVLFWLPFWTLTAACTAGIGWMAGWVHF